MAHDFFQVYVGDENAEDCKTKGLKFAEAKIGSKAVYCWVVTNTGNTYLKHISLRNKVLSFDQRNILSSLLAPGDSITVTTTGIITRREQNVVDAVAEPSTQSGSDLPFQDVAGSDTSEVGPTPMNPSIIIENTVRTFVLVCAGFSPSLRFMLGQIMVLNAALASTPRRSMISSERTFSTASLSKMLGTPTYPM
jgi:hypothetical protein